MGGALPNEWMFQVYLSLQLVGSDGSGCVYDTTGATGGGYLSTWYGDGGSAASPRLGLFFPVNVTLVANPAGPGVGYDTTNVAQAAAGCGAASGCNVTAWAGVPVGAQKWSSASATDTPAPYVILPPTAWPAKCNGLMSFAGNNYTAPAPAPAASAAPGQLRAYAGAMAALVLAALVL